MHGTVDFFDLQSEALANNPLGDPSSREVLVYLPPNHERGDTFCTTLLLPAYGSSHRTFLNYDIWQPSLLERLDALIEGGACPRTCVVIPDCRTRWGGSQFVDSPATGNYQSLLADEVLPAVEQRYNASKGPSSKIVVGRSSGGFGALRMVMDRPGVVAAVGSIAGDAAFDLSLRPLLLKAEIAFERSGGVGPFCERLIAEGPTHGSDYDAAFLVAAAAAYAPRRTDTIPFAPLPFSAADGTLDEQLWRSWLKADPCERVASAAAELRDLRMIHVEAGRSDEYGLQFAARLFARRAQEAGVSISYEEFDGGHRGTRARYLEVIPALLRSLTN